MSIGHIVLCVALWSMFSPVAYFYSQNPYQWPKKWGLLFALGGPVTAIGAMIDVWEHTSMGGDYTRNWKNDPENGIEVASWEELSGQPRRNMAWKAVMGTIAGLSAGAQIYGCVVLVLALQGKPAPAVPALGALCAVLLVLGIGMLVSDIFVLVDGINDPNIGERLTLPHAPWCPIFLYQVMVLILAYGVVLVCQTVRHHP